MAEEVRQEVDLHSLSKTQCVKPWPHKCVNSSSSSSSSPSFPKPICLHSVALERFRDFLEVEVVWEEPLEVEVDTEVLEEVEIWLRNLRACSVWRNYSVDSVSCRRRQSVNKEPVTQPPVAQGPSTPQQVTQAPQAPSATLVPVPGPSGLTVPSLPVLVPPRPEATIRREPMS